MLHVERKPNACVNLTKFVVSVREASFHMMGARSANDAQLEPSVAIATNMGIFLAYLVNIRYHLMGQEIAVHLVNFIMPVPIVVLHVHKKTVVWGQTYVKIHIQGPVYRGTELGV